MLRYSKELNSGRSLLYHADKATIGNYPSVQSENSMDLYFDITNLGDHKDIVFSLDIRTIYWYGNLNGLTTIQVYSNKSKGYIDFTTRKTCNAEWYIETEFVNENAKEYLKITLVLLNKNFVTGFMLYYSDNDFPYYVDYTYKPVFSIDKFRIYQTENYETLPHNIILNTVISKVLNADNNTLQELYWDNLDEYRSFIIHDFCLKFNDIKSIKIPKWITLLNISTNCIAERFIQKDGNTYPISRNSSTYNGEIPKQSLALVALIDVVGINSDDSVKLNPNNNQWAACEHYLVYDGEDDFYYYYHITNVESKPWYGDNMIQIIGTVKKKVTVLNNFSIKIPPLYTNIIKEVKLYA